jgi:nucleoside-triphosphatase THEP1
MKIAYTMSPGRGDTDLLMFKLAQLLEQNGWRTCGTVQINTENEAHHPCDMLVKVLPDGPVLRISQNLGQASKGCRLDTSALETAVGLVEKSFEAGTDVVIINKFGKHEAEGRGFRSIIAEALSTDVPVVVGLNRFNEGAFHDFADGHAVELKLDAHEIQEWLTSIRARSILAS